MSAVSMKQLLEAGVHFGHQTRRWNPKMKPYIYGERNGIHIIDLRQTVEEIVRASSFVEDVTAQGGSVLFVGTKKQAQGPVRENAERSAMPYVTYRWLGGMLTNFATIQKRIFYLKELRGMETSEELQALPKKERLRLIRERDKLELNLGGVAEMTRLPNALFIVDVNAEATAVAEAARLGIPVIALVDSNCDPDDIEYVIPGNDDAIRSAGLVAGAISDAAIAGRQAGATADVVEAEGDDTAAVGVS